MQSPKPTQELGKLVIDQKLLDPKPTGNVSGLAALVASSSTSTTERSSTGLGGALAGKVAGLTAAVARLLLLGRGALAAQVTLLAAVVAGRVAFGGAVAGLVGGVAACGWSR